MIPVNFVLVLSSNVKCDSCSCTQEVVRSVMFFDQVSGLVSAILLPLTRVLDGYSLLETSILD